MSQLLASFWVALGSALGGLSRYWLTIVGNRLLGAEFPWSTIAINVAGSLVIGVFAARSPSETTRLFVMIGLCGGFPTFSAFSLQTLTLLQEGAILKAMANVLLSVFLCVAATWTGWRLAT